MSEAEIPVGTEGGNRVPDFELKDQRGQSWRLADHRGKVVALVFYSKDGMQVCTKQMCSMRDRWTDYQRTGAEVVAISVGTEQSHKKFADRHELPQHLLADERGEVTARYGVKSLLGGSQRAVIVIDGAGVVRYRKAILPIFRPGDDEVIAAIQGAIPAQAVASAGGLRVRKR